MRELTLPPLSDDGCPVVRDTLMILDDRALTYSQPKRLREDTL